MSDDYVIVKEWRPPPTRRLIRAKRSSESTSARVSQPVIRRAHALYTLEPKRARAKAS
jgi:hypothetical protein